MGARIASFGSERDPRKEPYAVMPTVSDFEYLQGDWMAPRTG